MSISEPKTVKFNQAVPFLHVADVARSIEFYEAFGLHLLHILRDETTNVPFWAWVEVNHAKLMLAKADEPVIASQQAVLFYFYCDDVQAKHSELSANGIACSEINRPFYAPDGEFRVSDPDGYCLMVMQA